MKDHTIITALITGPIGGAVVAIAGWIRNRRKDAAETGLTVDQRWEQYADRIEGRMKALEKRVTELETQLETEQRHAKGLQAEVDKYRSLARTLLRHVIKLRDALAKAHAEVPDIPPDIEDALTGIDLP